MVFYSTHIEFCDDGSFESSSQCGSKWDGSQRNERGNEEVHANDKNRNKQLDFESENRYTENRYTCNHNIQIDC